MNNNPEDWRTNTSAVENMGLPICPGGSAAPANWVSLLIYAEHWKHNQQWIRSKQETHVPSPFCTSLGTHSSCAPAQLTCWGGYSCYCQLCSCCRATDHIRHTIYKIVDRFLRQETFVPCPFFCMPSTKRCSHEHVRKNYYILPSEEMHSVCTHNWEHMHMCLHNIFSS
jgi:hypothetical protein